MKRFIQRNFSFISFVTEINSNACLFIKILYMCFFFSLSQYNAQHIFKKIIYLLITLKFQLWKHFKPSSNDFFYIIIDVVRLQNSIVHSEADKQNND